MNAGASAINLKDELCFRMLSPELVDLIKNVLLAVIGPVSAILSAFLTHRYDLGRLKMERKNRMMPELLGIRRKALEEVNSKMVDCHLRIHHYGNLNPTTLSEFEREVRDPIDAFEKCLNANFIWYSADLLNKLSAVRGSFIQARLAIWLSLPSSQLPGVNIASYPVQTRTIDFVNVEKNFDAACLAIRESLGIPDLEKYLKDALAVP